MWLHLDEIYFSFKDSLGTWHVHETLTANVAKDSWSYIAITFNSTDNSVEICKNDVWEYSATETGDMAANDEPLRIGTRDYPDYADYFFAGIIDEVAIYNRVLTSEEIQHHYQDGLHGLGYDVECVTPPDGLVSWWPGDENADDIVGSNIGTLVGSATFAAGRVDQAFSFDGVDDYVDIGTLGSIGSNLNTGVTVDFWIKTTSTITKTRVLGIAELANRWLIQLNQEIQGDIVVFLQSNDGQEKLLYRTGYVGLNDGTWHHVAIFVQASTNTAKIWINGNPIVGTYDKAIIGTMVDFSDSVYIGAFHDMRGMNEAKGPFFSGELDEIEFFNRKLTDSEILDIYRAGSAGKCKELVNQPPVAVCMDIEIPVVENCQSRIITAGDVDGGSTDPDEGDTISLSINNIGPLPLGDTFVTLTVTDEYGASDTCEAKVTVVDTTPPVIISVSVSPDILRPPNHKMFLITPTIDASDNCDSDLTIVVTSISMDEGDETNTFDPIYDDTLGDGHTTNDFQWGENGDIYLRAERSGKGIGRTYTITYKVVDASDNSSATLTAQVTVPHDQKK